MTIPIPVIWGVVQMVHQEASARSNAAADRARMQMERERLAEELAARDRQEERQKEVLLQVLNASTRMQELKVEAIISMFREAKTMLEGHQTILGAQKSNLDRAMLEGELTAQKHALIMQQHAQIDRELSAIDDKLMELVDLCLDAVARLNPGVRLSEIEVSVHRGLLS